MKLETLSLKCVWNMVLTANQDMIVYLVSESGKLTYRINDERIFFGRNDETSIRVLIGTLAKKLPDSPPFDCPQKSCQIAMELMTQLLTEMGQNGICVQFLTCPAEKASIFLARVGNSEEQVGLAGDPYSREYFLEILQALHTLFVVVENDLGELAFAS